MTNRKNSSADGDAARIEDELIQSILEASDDELREYVSKIGEDPDQIVVAVEATIQRAISTSGQEQLRRAKAEFEAWRGQQSGALFKPPTQGQPILDRLRSANTNVPMMLAARKGKDLSSSDEDGLAEDYEEAERLERDADKE